MQGETPFDTNEKYTLIMYSHPIEPEALAAVQKYALEYTVPLMAIHSAGFYSYFRTILPGNFPIVDTHPDSTATTDLRLLTPWPELSEFAAAQTKDIDNQSSHDHGHIPYIALLLHFLKEWKEKNGSLPTTYKDKTAFRKTVANATRTDSPEGGEENFEEGVAAVLKTVSAPTLSSAVREVLEYKPNEVTEPMYLWNPANKGIAGSRLGFLDHCRCNQAILR